MYRMVYTKQAVKDLDVLKKANVAQKAHGLLDIIRENPYQNPPRYEKLVGNLEGAYSRRINIQHRIVYQVFEEPFSIGGIQYKGIIKIIRMWTHYDGI